jgi:hypothetical protein
MLVVAAAFSVGVAVSCGDSSETEVGSGGEGGGAADTYVTSDCGSCVARSCQEQIDACAADPGCASYLECLNACPTGPVGNVDQDCEAACPVADNSTTEGLKADLTLCRQDGPGSECGPCGVSSILEQQCSMSTETNACAICEDESCCETYIACRDDATCWALKDCLQACPQTDDACWDQCMADYGDGMDLFGERMTCIFAQCGIECGSGECNACVTAACPNSSLQCYQRADCWLLEGCVGDCGGDTTCIQGCYDTYPDATAIFEVLASCSVANCAQACDA